MEEERGDSGSTGTVLRPPGQLWAGKVREGQGAEDRGTHSQAHTRWSPTNRESTERSQTYQAR